MATGPSIKGEVIIDTQSVQRAEKSLKSLQVNVQKLSNSTGQSSGKISKAFSENEKTFRQLAESVTQASKQEKQHARQAAKLQSEVQKAANKVAAFESSVRKSNASTRTQEKLIKQATAKLKGYESAAGEAVQDGQALNAINTELNTGLSQLQRNLKAASDEQKRSEKAKQQEVKATQDQQKANARVQKQLSQAENRYTRLTSSIRSSSLSADKQANLIRELKTQHQNLSATLQRTDATTDEVAAAQRAYNQAATKATTATNEANRAMSTQSVGKFNQEMQNLTSSVQVALGPLSGVASRIQAMTALFRRNAASTAALLGSITGFTVALAKSAQVASQAEMQQVALEQRLKSMGEQARLTGQDVQQMAYDLSESTMLSINQVRNATQTLMNFGNIARNQFDDVITAAKGLSVELGKGFNSVLRKVARTIDDPIDGLQRLERDAGKFNETAKEQIETLTRQGKTFEATDLILKQLSGSQASAEAEASTLLGTLDTLQSKVQQLAEQLFNSSSASDQAQKTLQTLVDRVDDFAKSDGAEKLASAFAKTLEYFAYAAKVAADNANLIVQAIVFLAGSAVGKGIIAVSKLLLNVKNLSAGFRAASASIDTASTSISRFGKAARIARSMAFPIIGLVASIASGYYAMSKAGEIVNESQKNLNKTLGNSTDVVGQLSKRIDNQLKNNRDLSKAQVDRVNNTKENIQQEVTALKQGLDSQKDILEENTNDLELQIKRREKVYDQFSVGGSLGDLGKVTSNREGAQLIKSLQLDKDALDNVENLNRIIDADLGPTITKLAKRALDAKTDINEFESQITTLRGEMRELDQAVQDMELGPRSRTSNQIYNDFKENISELRDNFGGTRQEVDELENSLKDSVAALRDLKKSGKGTQEDFDVTREITLRIRRQLKEARNETSFFEEQVSKVRDRFTEVGREIRNALTEQDLSEQFNIEDEVADFRKQLDGMIEQDFFNLKGELNLVGDRSQVSQALGDQMRVRNQLERQNDAQESLNKKYSEGRTRVAEIRNEFKNLSENAMDSNAPTFNLSRINKQLKGEMGQLEQEAMEIADKPFTGDNIQEQYQQRLDRLREMVDLEKGEWSELAGHIKENMESATRFQTLQTNMKATEQVIGSVTDAMAAAGKEQTKEYQAMAAAQAAISQGLAVASVWADPTSTFYEKVAQAASAAIAVGSQIQQINSVSAASGGYIQGPGTSTSDSIPANLSDGEFVMQAKAVQKIGRRNLEQMNAGKAPSRASGGSVGSSFGGSSKGFGGGDVNVQIIDQSSGNKDYSQQEVVNDNGRKEIQIMIKDAVKESINKGEMDREMNNNYGLKRKGRRV